MSSQDLLLTCQFLPLVARVRWALWRSPVTSYSKKWEEDASRELSVARERGAAELIPFEVWRRAHAVKRAARFIPRASCLTQALALQVILAREGEPSALVLGVDAVPNGRKRFEAHAWIEWRGRVVIGGPVGRWKPLLTGEPRGTGTSGAASSPLTRGATP